MDYEQAEKILNADVWRISKSTEGERKIFADQKEGGFFTFVLKSGQRFVSHFSEEGYNILNKKRRLTFRPIPVGNKLIGLEEFSWIVPVGIFSDFLSGGSQEEFKFSEDIAEKDKQLYMDLLDSRPFDPMSGTDGPIPLFYKADEKAKDYFRNCRKSLQQSKSIKSNQGR